MFRIAIPREREIERCNYPAKREREAIVNQNIKISVRVEENIWSFFFLHLPVVLQI